MDSTGKDKTQSHDTSEALKRVLRWFRHVRRLERNVARLEAENAKLRGEGPEFPAGHLCSPIPSAEDIEETFRRGGFGPPFAGVELHEARQHELLEQFAAWYPEWPFPDKETEGWRYFSDNGSYSFVDGFTLFCMLRRLRPARIIEVGSGMSSALMLDINERVFAGAIELTFIDPDMIRLKPRLKASDAGRVRLIEKKVQDVALETFDVLQPGDVLFIDSSHVSKVGSDVNRLFFDVIPRLKPGVFVHIHDIASRLEYPRDWLESGRAWNEQYLLRAFLMYNREFEIELFSAWLIDVKQAFIRERMPRLAQGGGGQLWLRRVR